MLKLFRRFRCFAQSPMIKHPFLKPRSLLRTSFKPKMRPQGEKKRGRRAQALLDQQGKKVNAGSLW